MKKLTLVVALILACAAPAYAQFTGTWPRDAAGQSAPPTMHQQFGIASANTSTTGANNTAVTLTIPAAASQRGKIHSVSAFCSSGSASISITDGGTTIFTTENTFVTTTIKSLTWIPALTGALNSAMVITLSTCGVGNAGTLNTEVDRY